MANDSPIVLYVEDEEEDRFLMGVAFEREALKSALRTANDGRAAIDYLDGNGDYADRVKHPSPAVVLLDLNLPGAHGFEVLEWIRRHPEHHELPVVIFSSSEREEDQARAKALGANQFIKKPGSGLRFRDVVRRLKQEWLIGGG